MCGTSSSSCRFGTGLGGKKINLVENHAVVAISWEITTICVRICGIMRFWLRNHHRD